MKNNWKNLQDLLFFQEGPGVRKNQFRNNGVKLLNVGNINDKKLNLDTTSIFISEEEAYGKYSHFLVEDGDLLICCSGIVVDNFHNKIVFAEEKHLPLCLNTSTMRFRTLNDDILNIKYFYYFLMTKLFKEQLQKLITGSAQLNFGPSHIKKIFMPIVDLNKQKQIAKTLDKAQELIDLRKESIAKLDELAKSIFIDMFGDPVSNPKGWTIEKFVKYIDYIGDIGSNGSNAVISKNLKMSDKKDFALMVRTVNLNKNDFNNDVKYVSEETYNFFKKSKIYGGEIIMNKIGSAGKFWIMPKLNIPVSLGLNQLMIKLKDLNTKFLYYFLSTEYGQVMIASKTNGAVTKSITKGAVKDFDIAVPPKDLQNKFASIIEKIEEHKSLYEQELEKLEENFQALLQQSFKE